MTVLLQITCKNDKTAEKLIDKLEGKKGVLDMGIVEPVEEEEELEQEEELYVPKGKELQALLTEVKEILGVDTLKDIYATHDAEKLKDLDKGDWPTVYAEAENLLAAHAKKEEAAKADKSAKGKGKGKGKGKDKAAKEDKPAKGKGKGKGKDDVKTSLADTKVLCDKVNRKSGLEAQREILAEFGLNTSRGVNDKLEQSTLNSIAAAMRHALEE